MKLLEYTLLDIDEYLAQRATHRAVTLFGRCHRIVRLVSEQLELLETMAPKQYQKSRLQLGNGRGQESPGSRVIVQMLPHIGRSYESVYLRARGLTVEAIYDSKHSHDDAYALAACLIELDELFQKIPL